MLHDWLKKIAPLFHPIRSQTKTDRDTLAQIFPRYASATRTVLATSFDWFNALTVFFGFDLTRLNSKPLLSRRNLTKSVKTIL